MSSDSTSGSPSVSPITRRCPLARAAALAPVSILLAYWPLATRSEMTPKVLVVEVRRLRALRLGR